jgi:uncharacterized FlaG/YvyC family protein
LENQANKVRADLMGTFHNKRHLFEEKRKTFTPKEENATPVTEEQSDIQSTVRKELAWVCGHIAKDLDVEYQIDLANTKATGDIIVDEASGEALVKAIPPTNLLLLEKRLKQFHELLATIPTLDPAKGFRPDPDREAGIYKAREVRKARTKKDARVLVLYQATKEHPAQTQVISEDVETGQIQEQEWSALLTPAIKSDLIERCENLLRAVKKARSRANEMEMDVATNRIGKKLLDYILQPLDSKDSGAAA